MLRSRLTLIRPWIGQSLLFSGVLALFLATSLTGCATRGGTEAETLDGETEPFVPLPIATSKVGSLILELDKTLKAWQQAVVTNNAVMLRRMELILRNEVNDSFEEVVQGLESPAPAIRQTAATALGFSGREEALSPLAAALHDSDPRVVSNALIGLGQLGSPLSPVSVISHQLRSSGDHMIRSNAAYALGRIAKNGGARESDAREACRQGLYDEFAGVRSQCASVLGVLSDEEAIPDLAVLMEDKEELVAKPAILALGSIARAEPKALGEVARALTSAFGRVNRSRRNWIHAELVHISERDFETDLGAWREWAYSLP